MATDQQVSDLASSKYKMPGLMIPDEKKDLKESMTDEEWKNGEEAKKEWEKQELPKREEWLEIFPEMEELIPEKLEELWEKAAALFVKMKIVRNVVDKSQEDPFTKWFFINWSKYEDGIALKKVYQDIKRFKDYKVYFEKKRVKELLRFSDTKETEKTKYNIDKMFAREGLLIDIALSTGLAIKRAGTSYKALCPFHKEKTPSFALYPDNWFHCFSCQKHGNFIDFLMHVKGIEFKEALREASYHL